MIRRAALHALPVGAMAGRAEEVPWTLLTYISEGDSITANTDSYAERWADDNFALDYTNCAVGGSMVSDLNARLETTMANAVADETLMTVMIGANDLGGSSASTSVADYAAGMLAYVAAAKALVPSLRVGLCGVLPIDEARYGGGALAGFNERRAELNALLRAAVGDEIDFYAPIGDGFADALAEDETLSGEGIHWTAAGYDLMDPIFAAVMDPILAGATGTAPSAFTLDDITGAELETAYTAEMIVTGLGMGQTATASLTGSGQMARGAGSFGAGPITVTNGDRITVSVTASDQYETAASATLTIGGVTDVFTVTTKAESAVPVSVTFGTPAAFDFSDFSGSTVTTFEGISHPGGLAEVALYSAGSTRSITGVEWQPSGGGTGTAGAMTGEMKSGDYQLSAWSAEIGAGTYDLVVTTASIAFGLGMVPWATSNAGAATGQQSRAFAYSFETVAMDAAQVVAPGGLGFVLAVSMPAIDSRPDGSTERAELYMDEANNNFGDLYLSVATLTETATPEVTRADLGGLGMLAFSRPPE